MNVLGLIPARGGSKGVPRKNLALLAGRPLLAHTVEQALASRALGRVVVSTEDAEIAEKARERGAEVPFLRPLELAQDSTPALPVMRQAVEALEEAGWPVEVLVYLQPTSPLRRARHIDAAVDLLVREGADTVVSVVSVPHNMNPVSLMRLEGGELKPYLERGVDPLRRQDKPQLWARNGPAVLAMTRRTLMELGVLYGPRTLPLVMEPEESLDVDTPFDLELLEALFASGHLPD